LTMAGALLIISIFIFIRHKANVPAFLIASLVFLILAYLMPAWLKPVYIFWMKLAFVLGWINTRVLLLIMFYLVFTLIGIVTRLLRIDLLEKKIDKTRESYWNKKVKKAFVAADYERQF